MHSSPFSRGQSLALLSKVFPCISLCPLDGQAKDDGEVDEASKFEAEDSASNACGPSVIMQSVSADLQLGAKVETKEADITAKVQSKKSPVNTDSPSVLWMNETQNGWVTYSKEVGDALEDALREGKSELALSILTSSSGSSAVMHQFDLTNNMVLANTTGHSSRIRRHVLKNAAEDFWETLSMKCEPPQSLSGEAGLKVIEKVWSSEETMSGKNVGLGFLFLYSLLGGGSRFKLIRSSNWYGDYGEGVQGRGTVVVVDSKKQAAVSSSANDAHRLGLLLSQLYADRHSKSLPSSVINILARNRQVPKENPSF